MGTNAARQVEREHDDGIVRRSVDLDIRAVNEEARSVEVIASTDTIDSHGDVVEQKFDLKRFKKNPVVLFNHNRFEAGYFGGGTVEPEALLPIGKARDTKVVDGKLQATLVFGSKEYSEIADRIFLGFKEGILRAVSIGFRPGKVTKELDEHGKEFFRLTNNELFEISVVPIGSNPDAVAKSLDADRTLMRRLADATSAGEPGAPTEKTPMDPKELQAALDKAKIDLGVSQKALDDATTRGARLETELAATKASLEQTQKAVEQEKSRADALEQKSAEAEVDALVGKKIIPASKAAFLKLRMSAPADFAEVVKGLPELPVLRDVTGGDPSPRNGAADGSAADTKSYVADVQKRAAS